VMGGRLQYHSRPSPHPSREGHDFSRAEKALKLSDARQRPRRKPAGAKARTSFMTLTSARLKPCPSRSYCAHNETHVSIIRNHRPSPPSITGRARLQSCRKGA
jgi:hypothetical protein